ncbi:MAG: hypothetical protein ACK55Z_25075, partial [bacterium]
MLCVKDVLHIWDEQSAKDWSAAVENRSEVIAPKAKPQRDFLGAFNMQFAILNIVNVFALIIMICVLMPIFTILAVISFYV